jgi:hypothetical protein
MPSAKEAKMNKLLKRITITLVILIVISPAGILLPMFFNAGEAWGEWSARTVKGLIGYIPEGLARYTDVWKAPLSGYSLNSHDPSIARQSVYYLLSGLIGAAITVGVMYLISKIIIRNGK